MSYTLQKPMEGRYASGLIGSKYQAIEAWLTPGMYRALDLSAHDPIMRDAKGMPLEFDSLESVTRWLTELSRTGKRPPVPVFQNRVTRDLPVVTVSGDKATVAFISAVRPPEGGVKIGLVRMEARDFAQIYIPSADDEKFILKQWAAHIDTVGATDELSECWEKYFPDLKESSPMPDAAETKPVTRKPPGRPVARVVAPRPAPVRVPGSPLRAVAPVRTFAARPPAPVRMPGPAGRPMPPSTAPKKDHVPAPLRGPRPGDDKAPVPPDNPSMPKRSRAASPAPDVSPKDRARLIALAEKEDPTVDAELAKIAKGMGILNVTAGMNLGKPGSHSVFARKMLLCGAFSDEEIDGAAGERFEGIYKNFAATQRSYMKKTYGIVCPRLVRSA